jgi:hypothetical protein
MREDLSHHAKEKKKGPATLLFPFILFSILGHPNKKMKGAPPSFK